MRSNTKMINMLILRFNLILPRSRQAVKALDLGTEVLLSASACNHSSKIKNQISNGAIVFLKH